MVLKCKLSNYGCLLQKLPLIKFGEAFPSPFDGSKTSILFSNKNILSK